MAESVPTAKSLGQLDLALSLAWRSPCDPKTLTRAARDHLARRPAFALEAALAALHWMSQDKLILCRQPILRNAMGIPLEALESEVLRLPTAERKRLLDRVVASLDVDAARDAAWDAVAAAREAEATKDPALMVPLDEVLEQLRADLQ